MVWRFSDGRAGHDAQTLGLAAALRARTAARIFDLRVRGRTRALGWWLSGRYPPADGLPRPDLLIGAGHSTHFHLLAARRRWGGRIIVCMKPSLPLSWFDLCLIPEHDRPPRRDNVLRTIGALGCVAPGGRHDPDTGLILVGGPSRHVRWDSARLLTQVEALLAARPLRRWLLHTSPRTPQALARRLAAMRGFDYLPFPAVERAALVRHMGEAGEIWVSSDSVSMLCEALSSGARVGLLEVPRAGRNRVSAGVAMLSGRGWLGAAGRWRPASARRPQLDEAGRCADWVARRWLTGH